MYSNSDIPDLFCTNLLFPFYILYFISFFIHVYIVQVGIYVTIRYFTYSYHNKNRGHEVFSTILHFHKARYISPSGIHPTFAKLLPLPARISEISFCTSTLIKRVFNTVCSGTCASIKLYRAKLHQLLSRPLSINLSSTFHYDSFL